MRQEQAETELEGLDAFAPPGKPSELTELSEPEVSLESPEDTELPSPRSSISRNPLSRVRATPSCRGTEEGTREPSRTRHLPHHPFLPARRASSRRGRLRRVQGGHRPARAVSSPGTESPRIAGITDSSRSLLVIHAVQLEPTRLQGRTHLPRPKHRKRPIHQQRPTSLPRRQSGQGSATASGRATRSGTFPPPTIATPGCTSRLARRTPSGTRI